MSEIPEWVDNLRDELTDARAELAALKASISDLLRAAYDAGYSEHGLVRTSTYRADRDATLRAIGDAS